MPDISGKGCRDPLDIHGGQPEATIIGGGVRVPTIQAAFANGNTGNFFWIMAGSDQCDYEQITRGLGREFEAVDSIAIKPYSSLRWQHATQDCVKELKQEYHLEPGSIEEVAIDSFAWVKTHKVYNPSDRVDAQISIPYTVSMVLLGEHPGPAWYTPENMKSDRVAKIMKKVKVEIEDKFRNQALYSLEPHQIDRIIETIYRFEAIEDISAFMPLLQGS